MRPGPRVSEEITIQRFESKIFPLESGCWYWAGSKASPGADNHDYGRFGLKKQVVWAHRFAYELWKGPIPDGLEIDHLCRVRPCVNPAHLEAVTQAENRRRAMKTHCIKGHAYDFANTGWHRGYKRCRACDRDRHRTVRA